MWSIVKNFVKVQLLVILVAIPLAFYHPNLVDKFLKLFDRDQSISLHYKSSEAGDVLFTSEELSKFNGEDGNPIYLAILGSVFDVTKGAQHYGPGCGYNFFVGRDASTSFITGDFESYSPDTSDDILDLGQDSLLGLHNWKKFYEKEYQYKGKLIGRFYDAAGEPTEYNERYSNLLEVAKVSKAIAEEERTRYPDCNIQWSEETGTRVWCTTESGGKSRSWSGYPRKFFELGQENFRCACIREEELDSTEIMIKPYENCTERSQECFYIVD